MRKEIVTLAMERYQELLAKEIELADIKRLLASIGAPDVHAPDISPDVEV